MELFHSQMLRHMINICIEQAIVCFKGSNVLNYDEFLSLKVVLILSNSADPDENAALCCISSGSSLFA